MSSSSSSTKPSIATNNKDSSLVNLPYLPDDLLLNCLARVSRLNYQNLSLVSKRFRSLIASKELWETRKLLGRTESRLYMCLSLDDRNTIWFTLCRKPIRNPNPNKSSDNVMVSISTRNSSSACWRGHYVAVGSSIYKIGGYVNYEPSSKVLFMDCRSHTWYEAPSMQMAWNHNPVRVLDGKIYVVGGSDNSSSTLIDCFDPKTQTWEHLPSFNGKIHTRCTIQSLAIRGKLYLFGKNNNMVYKPKENKWDAIELEMGFPRDIDYYTCVVDNMIYRYGYNGMLEWFDFKGRSWRVLEGLKELSKILPKHRGYVRLVDYGGNIAVLWQKNSVREKKIWCAEIALERCKIYKIYGKVEWCNVVLTVPANHSSIEFWQCVVATI